ARQTARRTERARAEREQAEAALRPIRHPLQGKLEEALQRCPRLAPTRVRATNTSYWFHQRRLLGGARHAHRGAVPSTRPAVLGWEAFIYRMVQRSRDLVLVPTLCPAVTPGGRAVGGPVVTRGVALALADRAAAERDADPGAGRQPKPPGLAGERLLHSHFRVLVVSAAFRGRGNGERLAMVFDAL
ncbi:unnamed protein product, partial [Phaeothamnion confervicola]